MFSETLFYGSGLPASQAVWSGNIAKADTQHAGRPLQENIYSYDPLGRLTGNVHLNGGLQVAAGTESGITYDRNGALTSFTRHDGAESHTYSITNTAGAPDFVFVDGDVDYMFLYDSNGNITAGPGLPEIRYNLLNLPCMAGAVTYRYLSDGTKVSALIKEQNGYLPYSTRIRNNGLPKNWANRYRFAGKEEQEISGTSIPLLDFGARYYYPLIPAWTSIDPLASSYTSHSQYGYCTSNPINFVDPERKNDYYFDDKGRWMVIENDDPYDRVLFNDNSSSIIENEKNIRNYIVISGSFFPFFLQCGFGGGCPVFRFGHTGQN